MSMSPPRSCAVAESSDSGPESDAAMILECKEGSRLQIPGGAENVLRAFYGSPKRRMQDCTTRVVRSLRARGRGGCPVVSKPVAVVASNTWLGCDPSPGHQKVLMVELKQEATIPDEFKVKPPAIYQNPADVPSAPQWLVFVRHAQAGHNVRKELTGRPDNPLTEHGREQARRAGAGPLGELLRSADLVVTSPLLRALETTALLLEAAGARDTRVLVHAGAIERCTAPCDKGTLKTDLMRVLPEAMQHWEGWEALPERFWAEPGEDAWGRVESFVEAVRRERPEGRIVFVGHGGFWEMVLGRYLENCEHCCCERFLA